jgi:hypothetical protein
MERIPERLSEYSRKRRQERQNRKRAQFLAGPIPVAWVTQAAALPGSALAAALAIWFKAGCEKSHRNLSICPTLLGRFRVKRVSGYRALNSLEEAGLVSIVRRRGACPLVTIRRVVKRGTTRMTEDTSAGTAG